MNKIIPYGKQTITDDDIQAVVDTLRGDFLTQGPAIAKFENEFAEYVGAKYAVAVSNGTAALHLSVIALKDSKPLRVITTPITFAASANCVLYEGGEVYFADIDPETFLIDINKVEKLIESKPEGFFSGIIPVDFAGRPVKMDSLRKISDKNNLWIIEDACHAPGAFFIDENNNTQHCGNCKYSNLTVFSFHPVKHIATGEGGMITTNSEDIYNKLLMLRSHGITRDLSIMNENHGGWYYEMQMLGYNYRITDIQSALGSSQLKKADEGLSRRKEIASRYLEKLADLPVVLPTKESLHGHALHLFVILTSKRKELYDFLRENKIYTQVHYIPVHTMPYYRNNLIEKFDLSFSEDYYSKCLSLPMYPGLSNEEQDYVINTIIKFFHS